MQLAATCLQDAKQCTPSVSGWRGLGDEEAATRTRRASLIVALRARNGTHAHVLVHSANFYLPSLSALALITFAFSAITLSLYAFKVCTFLAQNYTRLRFLML